MIPVRLLAVVLAAALVLPASMRAQDAPVAQREIRGLDFRKDGVWRRQARSVRAQRARLLTRRNFGMLNAPMAAAGGGPLSAGAPLAGAAAVSGVLQVPAVLFRFKDTPASVQTARPPSAYNDVLFAPTPTGASTGRPYTYASWYAQLSHGLLTIQGATYGYVALDSNEITYAGTPPCTGNPDPTSSECNGLFSNGKVPDPFTRMQNGLREALRKLDNQVDWTQYDSNGDGYVDLVAFIQPAFDGACGGSTNNHLWSHRSALSPVYLTHSYNSSGVQIKVADYILESGVGGVTGCDSTQIMPIGTVAHETGHGLGLPDLYDVNYLSAGIGRYSLMGYGLYFSGFSPARLDAWSLSQLGWVTVVPLLSAGTYSFGPVPTSDTAFYLPVFGSNPRGEYFLLENREAVQSDSVMISYNCQVWYQSPPPSNCGGGLLVYHVDSAQIAQHGFDADNTVNSGSIHGVEVVQADGRRNLDASLSPNCAGPTSGCYNYGDAGDEYPGTTGNLALTPTTVPAAVRTADGRPAGFFLKQVFQPAVNGPVQFQLTYPDWVVRATDSAAVIKFDGAAYHVFRSILDSGTVHTVAVDSVQFTASGRTRQEFRLWSNGKALTQTDTARAVPDTIVATLARFHKLIYTATVGGKVVADTGAGLVVADSAFFTQGRTVTLTATDTSGGVTPFLSWAGDTVSKNATITVPMGRPYTVRAVFLAPLNTADVVAQLLNGTGPLTTQQLQDLDQLGNNNGRFDVGDFLAWARATGAALTPAQRALVGALRLKSKGVSR